MEALDILRFLQYHPLSSRKNIAEGIGFAGSDATLKRLLSAQVSAGKIMVSGQGKATRYSLTSSCRIALPIDIDAYFQQDQDKRYNGLVNLDSSHKQKTGSGDLFCSTLL